MSQDAITAIETLLRIKEEDIEFVLLTLLKERKLNFTSLNNAYVKHLQDVEKESRSDLSEASACIYLSMVKPNDEEIKERCEGFIRKHKFIKLDEQTLNNF